MCGCSVFHRVATLMSSSRDYLRTGAGGKRGDLRCAGWFLYVFENGKELVNSVCKRVDRMQGQV